MIFPAGFDGDDHFNGVPYAPGSIKGARTWRVNDNGELFGVSFPVMWSPGENVAKCIRGTTTDGRHQSLWNPAPIRDASDWPDVCVPMLDSGHKCGFYGYMPESNSFPMFTYDRKTDDSECKGVTGIIEGYGHVVTGKRGFRCEKARIIAVAIPTKILGTAHIRSDDTKGTDAQKVDTLNLVGAVADKYPSARIYLNLEEMLADYPEHRGHKHRAETEETS